MLVPCISLILATVTVVAGLMINPKVCLLDVLIYLGFILYYLLYSGHYLFKATPEQEFTMIDDCFLVR